MTIILNNAPTFNWHLTRERIADKALEKLNELGVGETATPSPRNMALEALDGILKMLQFQGLHYPELSRGQFDFILFKNQQQNLLPADYYGYAEISYVNQTANADGSFPTAPANEVELPLVTVPTWQGIENKAQTAPFPLLVFIDVANVLWTWPIQTQNVACRMFYQKVIEDSRAGTSPQLRAPWALALPYGVAYELCHEFEVGPDKRRDLKAQWEEYRGICLMNETDLTPVHMGVRTVGGVRRVDGILNADSA